MSQTRSVGFRQRRQGVSPSDSSAVLGCSLPETRRRKQALTTELCETLQFSGRLFDPAVLERMRLESFLGQLSTVFLNLPGAEVDSYIAEALAGIVTHLGVDRGELAEVVSTRQLIVTHCYRVPGLPAQSRQMPGETLPWYISAIRRGEPLRLSHLPDDLPAEATAERAHVTRLGMKSHLMIPCKVTGEVVGAICFASFQRTIEWPPELVEPLRLLGELFTNARIRTKADAALRERELSLQQTDAGLRKLTALLLHAQEQERRRIAREMHDDWTQRLAILGIEMAKLEKREDIGARALPHLHAMQDSLVRLSEDVHALSRQLHPSILDDLGLVEALRSECATFSKREGIGVVFLPRSLPANLPSSVALSVYRIAQEALRNVAKHSGANEARVSLAMSDSDMVLRVRDKGAGFEPIVGRVQPGLGLSSMRERVELIQGQLTITAAPGKGTTVEVRVRLADKMS